MNANTRGQYRRKQAQHHAIERGRAATAAVSALIDGINRARVFIKAEAPELADQALVDAVITASEAARPNTPTKENQNDH